MSEKKDLQSLVKKVDLSDIKVLAVGIVLLIIPLLFLLLNFSTFGKKELSSSARDRLGMHKSAFSFQRTASQYTAGKGKALPTAARVVSPEKQWEEAFKRISTAKAHVPPQIAAMPKSKRKYFEAEMNTEMRTANALIAQKRYDEARVICDNILKTETENEYLRFMASGNLCTIYDATGNVAALRKEFLRYLDLLESLKIDGFEVNNAKTGYLAMNKMILDFKKVRADPAVRAHIQELLSKNQHQGNVTVDKLLDETLAGFTSFPSTKK